MKLFVVGRAAEKCYVPLNIIRRFFPFFQQTNCDFFLRIVRVRIWTIPQAAPFFLGFSLKFISSWWILEILEIFNSKQNVVFQRSRVSARVSFSTNTLTMLYFELLVTTLLVTSRDLR